MKADKERQVSMKNLSPKAIADAINKEYGLTNNPIQPEELIPHLKTIENNPTYLILHNKISYRVTVMKESILIRSYTWSYT